MLKGLNLSVKAGTVFWSVGGKRRRKEYHYRMHPGNETGRWRNRPGIGADAKKDRRAVFQKVGVQFQEGDYQPEIRVSELCEETACLYERPADWRKLCERFGIGDKTGHAVKKSFRRGAPAAVYCSGVATDPRDCVPGRADYRAGRKGTPDGVEDS